MSEEEVEKFEVTEYDLENEFNINRPTRRISKNKQIYGKHEQYAVLHLQVMITRFMLIHQHVINIIYTVVSLEHFSVFM
jgi:hypothetical protein